MKFSYPYIFLLFLIQACQKKPKVARALLPPFGLEVEIIAIKWVHFNNPTLSEQEKQKKEYDYLNPTIHSDCLDCATYRGSYFTLRLKNHTDKALLVSPDDFVMHNDSFKNEYITFGFNKKGYLVNLPDKLLVPAKSVVITDIMYRRLWNQFVGAEIDSTEDELFDNCFWIATQRQATKLLYRDNSRGKESKMTIFIPDKISVEKWYSRDFRTYEEARAYGQPYLAADGDSTRYPEYFAY